MSYLSLSLSLSLLYSMALDFEAYAEEWRHRGTSLPSDVGSDCVLYRDSK